MIQQQRTSSEYEKHINDLWFRGRIDHYVLPGRIRIPLYGRRHPLLIPRFLFERDLKQGMMLIES